jgi:hypothetical protein
MLDGVLNTSFNYAIGTARKCPVSLDVKQIDIQLIDFAPIRGLLHLYDFVPINANFKTFANTFPEIDYQVLSIQYLFSPTKDARATAIGSLMSLRRNSIQVTRSSRTQAYF